MSTLPSEGLSFQDTYSIPLYTQLQGVVIFQGGKVERIIIFEHCFIFYFGFCEIVYQMKKRNSSIYQILVLYFVI